MHSIQSLAESSPPKIGTKLSALSAVSSPSKQMSLPATSGAELKDTKPNPFMFSPTKPLNPVLNHVSRTVWPYLIYVYNVKCAKIRRIIIDKDMTVVLLNLSKVLNHFLAPG